LQLSDQAEPILLELLTMLDRAGYDFVAPTPATHERNLARRGEAAGHGLRDAFGWSLPFAADLLPALLFAAMRDAGLLGAAGAYWKSRVRVSRIHGRLFLHSAFPTDAADSVFFGPDSYRFVDFIRAELPRAGAVRRLVDIGAGSGVGAIMSAAFVPGARLTLLDVNPAALRLAAINARHAGIAVEAVEGDSIDAITGAIDVAIANPPYVMDDRDRLYRDGGDMHGGRVSLEWTLAAARRISPGGRVLLYTGVAIVEGRDALREALISSLGELGCSLRYCELDPDIFGEELEKPAYAGVERIAAVGAVVEVAR
jgi:methylase of polypeptide subunit release factors